MVITCTGDQDVTLGGVHEAYPGTQLRLQAAGIPDTGGSFDASEGDIEKKSGRISLYHDGRNLKIFIMPFQEIVQAWSWGKGLLDTE